MFNSFQRSAINNRSRSFGSGGIVLRAPLGEALTDELIAAKVPAVFAEHAHESRSEKFAFISTAELLREMRSAGFLPVEIRQGGSRDVEKRAYTKHLVRFRHRSTELALNGTHLEVIGGNAHDGTSQYWFMGGAFELKCWNGLIVCKEILDSIKVPHRGNVGDVIEASFRVVESFPLLGEKIAEMKALTLSQNEQTFLAQEAISQRWKQPEGQSVPIVTPEQVLRPRRSSDADSSLWSTFNRVQEAIIVGGTRTTTTDGQGRPSYRRAREVNGIGDNVRLNQSLWRIAEAFRAAKSGGASL